MKNDERISLLLKAKETNDYSKIYKEMLWLNNSILKRYKKSPIYEDLKQVAGLTLFKGLKAFNPEKSTKLSTYLFRWVRKNVAVEAFKQKNWYILHKPTEAINLINSLTYNLEDKIEYKLIHDYLYNILNIFDNKDKQIVIFTFGLYDEDSLSLRDIAKKISMSHEFVRTRQQYLIKTIKSSMR